MDLGEMLGTAAKEAQKHPELLSSVVGLVEGGASGKKTTSSAAKVASGTGSASAKGSPKATRAPKEAAGLGGLLGDLDVAGLTEHVGSWVGTGSNKRVTGPKVKQALGKQKIAAAAKKAGVSEDEAASGIAKLLPAVVDYLTPDGEVPPPSKAAERLDALTRSKP